MQIWCLKSAYNVKQDERENTSPQNECTDLWCCISKSLRRKTSHVSWSLATDLGSVKVKITIAVCTQAQ